jgi:hypothetical protein
MRLEASRLWRLVGRDAQRCWRMRAQKGLWMGPGALMRRRGCAVVRRKRTCQWLWEAQGANVRWWAALPQSLQRLETEHIADNRRSQVRDRPFLEQIKLIRDIRKVLRLAVAGARRRNRFDTIRFRAVHVARSQSIGPHHRPRRRRRFARHRRRFLGLDTRLRRDTEQRDHVRVFRLVIRLPVPHLAILEHPRRNARAWSAWRRAQWPPD